MNQAIVLLALAVVLVPLAVRLGLGSVLGYLLAGVAVGPLGLGLVGDAEAVTQVSELGVVLMLFLIGLNLEPRRLWAMRIAVFGGGALQMAACTVLIMPIGFWLGWTWQATLIGSLALSLSSTAIVVPILQERNLLLRPVGQKGFAMLLFEDIAAIPLLALAALLGQTLGTPSPVSPEAHASGWWRPLSQVGAIAGVVLAGRYLAYPAMRFIARLPVRELFTAFALLLVLGVAALMQAVGLSMGLGAFIAGVLLASSEYRHALENDILPFKGLLLGLFFMSVGMGMQLDLLATHGVQVAIGLVLITALKLVGVWLVLPLAGLHGQQRSLLAVLLAQGGEFAFVILATAQAVNVLPANEAALLTLITAVSMPVTPLLLRAFDRLARDDAGARPADDIPDERPQVLLAGFGRYGQIVARLLLGVGIKPTVIDHDADTVDSARKFGFQVYFGDATQPDLLAAAGAANAQLLVIAIDDSAQANQLVAAARQQWPQLRLAVRARDAVHAMELHGAGVHHVQRELFESSLRTGRAALEALGFDRFHARQVADEFRRYNERFARSDRSVLQNEDDLIKRVREAREQFEKQMQQDMQRQHQRHGDKSWQAGDAER
ncbi:MAG: monovalent cation:proton antiporter-2 (CPA2) family protein [Hydrogenophaga sp.]|uniref:monovalent cation:proton antiporter-2 (CPA2) family protein n=1 Tax=Hydrogenophaga sp. TaxID=1904254 RepID=UPI001D1AA8E7|nr:monovalent cation:proton antiporter-2 (CPA2) family protein [Hydrogenophaga sp.]MBX3611103.1 monovalent cation:proton antiporter-2 (CPA2) family protein [Hydrogenophaga sp.]